jgi:hypothetical protein
MFSIRNLAVAAAGAVAFVVGAELVGAVGSAAGKARAQEWMLREHKCRIKELTEGASREAE